MYNTANIPGHLTTFEVLVRRNEYPVIATRTTILNASTNSDLFSNEIISSRNRIDKYCHREHFTILTAAVRRFNVNKYGLRYIIIEKYIVSDSGRS